MRSIGRRRGGQLELSSAPRAGRSRRVRVVVSALLLGSASACANAIDINGMTGVTVDASGRPVLVAEICHGVVAGVTVTGPNRGEIANEVRAELAAPQPVEQSFVLDLARPLATGPGRRSSFLSIPTFTSP